MSTVACEGSPATLPPDSSLHRLRKAVGAGSIVAGAILIGFNPNRWDVVFVTLPRGHGIHVRDVVGMLLIALGIALMWRSRPA